MGVPVLQKSICQSTHTELSLTPHEKESLLGMVWLCIAIDTGYTASIYGIATIGTNS